MTITIDHKAFLDVLDGDLGFNDKRQAIRKFAAPFIEEIDVSDIERSFSGSPLIGERDDQVSPSPTHSGLLNALKVETLVWIIQSYHLLAKNEVPSVLKAIEDPHSYGVPTPPSSRSKLPYEFGVSEAQMMTCGTVLREYREKFGSGKISIEGMGMGTLINTIDNAIEEGYGTTEEIVAALRKVVIEQDKLDAVATVLNDRPDADLSVDAAMVDPSLTNALLNVMFGEREAEAFDAPDVAVQMPGEEQLVQAKVLTDALGLPDIGKLIEERNKAINDLATRPAATIGAPVATKIEIEGIPNGTSKAVDVKTVFSGLRKGFDGLQVPVFEWDGPHPHVPDVDEDYQFDQSALRRVLRALLMNKPIYLHGHTGSGKTTLIEQIAARLNWPVVRLNLHGEITQMDLLGREVLRNKGGTTVSEYVTGPVPQAMAGPNILLLDEVDYIRANVSYALQRALEGKGLMLTEDGGRIITPHPQFRFVGTGNTQMKGDEYGMYREARIQSSAFINRWSNWVHVDYMTKSARRKLIKAKVPGFAEELLEKTVQYTVEHLRAFTSAEIIQPLSPRDYLETAECQVCFTVMGLSQDEAMKEAIQATIIDAAVPQDAQVLKGIIKNVFDINV